MRKVLRLYTDGASRGNPGDSGLGIVIKDEQGATLHELPVWLGPATNNEAEYHALIEGLKAVAEWHPDRLEVYLDSKLVVEQINGRWKIRKRELTPLYRQAKELLEKFPDSVVMHIEREKNADADRVANKAIDDHVKAAGKGG